MPEKPSNNSLSVKYALTVTLQKHLYNLEPSEQFDISKKGSL